MQHELSISYSTGPRQRRARKNVRGERDIHADLVIGADRPRAITHKRAKLDLQEFGAPSMVLWMRLSKRPADRRKRLDFSTREIARPANPTIYSKSVLRIQRRVR